MCVVNEAPRRTHTTITPLSRFHQLHSSDRIGYHYDSLLPYLLSAYEALKPTLTDHRAMFGILRDDQVGANFVVLLLVKLDSTDVLIGEAFLYVHHAPPSRGDIVWDAAHPREQVGTPR